MTTMERPAVVIEREDLYRMLSGAYENYRDVYEALVKHLPADVLMCYLAHIDSPATYADTPYILRRLVEKRFVELRQQLRHTTMKQDRRYSKLLSQVFRPNIYNWIKVDCRNIQKRIFSCHYSNQFRIFVPYLDDDLVDGQHRPRDEEQRRQSMVSALRVLSFARDSNGLDRLCVAAFAFHVLRDKNIVVRGKMWPYMPGGQYDVVIPKENDHLRLLETVADEYGSLLQRGVDLFAIMSKVLSGEEEYNSFYNYYDGTLSIRGPFFCDEVWSKIENRIHWGFEDHDEAGGEKKGGRHWLLELVRGELKTEGITTTLADIQKSMNRCFGRKFSGGGRRMAQLRMGLLLESVVSAVVSKLHAKRRGSLVVKVLETGEIKLRVRLERLFRGGNDKRKSPPLTRHRFINYFSQVWRFLKNSSDMYTLCEMLYNAMLFTKRVPLRIEMLDWRKARLNVKFLEVTKKYRCYLHMAADVVRAYKRCKRSGVDLTFYFNDEIYKLTSEHRHFSYNHRFNTITRAYKVVKENNTLESDCFLLHESCWLDLTSMLAEEGVSFNHKEDCVFKRYGGTVPPWL